MYDMNVRELISVECNRQETGITLLVLVVTIVVLLLLAGVSMSVFIGENGIFARAIEAKEATEKARIKDIVDVTLFEWQISKYTEGANLDDFLNDKVTSGEFDAVIHNKDGTYTVEVDGYIVIVDIEGIRVSEPEKAGALPRIQTYMFQKNGSDLEEGIYYDTVAITVNILNKEDLGSIDAVTLTDSEGNVISQEVDVIGNRGGVASFLVTKTDTYTAFVQSTTNGIQKTATVEISVRVVPEQWVSTTISDRDWYSYGDATVNMPNLKGDMLPIKYIGETQDGNKWANAITVDGSMWVWIPRFAYKITEGYHSQTAGAVEIAFIDTHNMFLNTKDTGSITANPAEEGAGTEKWLVHPAFTSDAANGGGFGELTGIWFAKFESTGTRTNLTVKPGEQTLKDMHASEQFLLAKSATYGESVNLRSHMVKNSEWGAVVYLGQSRYGAHAKIENTVDAGYHAGGSAVASTIYTTNKTQSTTHNATGVYDMSGGTWERVASYVNNQHSSLTTYGGANAGDFYGSDEEQNVSTAYKTVYMVGNGDYQSSNYEANKHFKGDAIYETSSQSNLGNGTWNEASSYFPYSDRTFFVRGGGLTMDHAGNFYFGFSNGSGDIYTTFRAALCPP